MQGLFKTIVCLWLLAGTLARPALADETPFATLYTARLIPTGETEFGQAVRFGAGRPHESYAALEGGSEIEFGAAPDLQLAGYINYRWQRERLGTAPARSGLDFTNVSLEAIWQLADSTAHPLGVALYLEPAYGPDHRELEGKVILQKNLFDQRLVLATNIALEQEWNRGAGNWQKNSELRLLLGAAWWLTPKWAVGTEFEAKREYDGLLIWQKSAPAADSFFLGPTLHYDSGEYSMTLGMQTQLPFAANLSGEPGETVSGFAHEEERYRIQINVEFDI
ncbi:MAG: hypothetical protein KGJ75_11245 [Alphaproteobacteria bacterium]|nr:hypothetical protein [Alphaproteobacteria bacterium]